MNTKTKNIVIDAIGVIIVLAGIYKEFFTEKPMPVWEWAVIIGVGIFLIAFNVKGIKAKLTKYINKKSG